MKTLILIAVLGSALSADDTKEENTKRLDAAQEVLRAAMNADDKSIPQDLIDAAQCVAIVPGLKQAGFIVGAKYGKGYLMCRKTGAGWQGPAAVRIEGGSVGLQIGGGETDLVLLVMNEAGRDKILKSEFKVGGSAAVMAGPVGRSAQAETDAFMRAEILSYSRSRGVFAGISLGGSTLREDLDDNQAIYGKSLSNEQILLKPGVATPSMGRALVQQLGAVSARAKK